MCNKTYINPHKNQSQIKITSKKTLNSLYELKNHQKKLTFLYRQNALPLAYRYARYARHTNMHTDTHIEIWISRNLKQKWKIYISEISKGGAVTVAFWRLAGASNHNKVKLESLKPRHFTSFLNESHKLKWNPWKK